MLGLFARRRRNQDSIPTPQLEIKPKEVAIFSPQFIGSKLSIIAREKYPDSARINTTNVTDLHDYVYGDFNLLTGSVASLRGCVTGCRGCATDVIGDVTNFRGDFANL